MASDQPSFVRRLIDSAKRNPVLSALAVIGVIFVALGAARGGGREIWQLINGASPTTDAPANIAPVGVSRANPMGTTRVALFTTDSTECRYLVVYPVPFEGTSPSTFTLDGVSKTLTLFEKAAGQLFVMKGYAPGSYAFSLRRNSLTTNAVPAPSRDHGSVVLADNTRYVAIEFSDASAKVAVISRAEMNDAMAKFNLSAPKCETVKAGVSW